MVGPGDNAGQGPEIINFPGSQPRMQRPRLAHEAPKRLRQSDEALSDEDELARVRALLDTVTIKQRVRTVRFLAFLAFTLVALGVAILVPMSEARLGVLLSFTLLLAWCCISDAEDVLTVGMHLKHVRSLVAGFPEASNNADHA